jgi:type IV pilus assembly protein PilO
MVGISKKLIRGVLIVVVAVDLVLAGINWQMANSPHAPQAELNLLKKQYALQAADITRAEAIRKALPEIERQCDAFFQHDLRPVGSGYSSIVSDLGGMSRVAGLRTENLSFRQHPADKRGVIEVDISGLVSGDYSSVVRFINGLEHSNTFYVLDGLSLAAGSAGELRLNLQMRTYFRT